MKNSLHFEASTHVRCSAKRSIEPFFPARHPFFQIEYQTFLPFSSAEMFLVAFKCVYVSNICIQLQF